MSLVTNNVKLKESIEEIVYQIQMEKVIPIIGYDLLFNEFESNNGDKDFLKRLIKKHAQNENLEVEYPDAKTGYDLINSYYHKSTNKNSFKARLSKTIRENRFDWELIPESYRKLVSIKNFKLFINATFTNTVELSVNAYRAEGNNEGNIKNSYRILNFSPYDPDDMPEAALSRNFRINFAQPIIYNLFGTHDERRGDYILTDADYIELIYDLIINKQEKYTNLLSYLNEGYLLFLGCNFPDWFFRFFIRVCAGDRLDAETVIQRKAVIDSLNLNKVDSSRSVFITQYGIQTLDIDCNTLVDEIYRTLKREDSQSILDDKENNKVFISYCRKDVEVSNAIETQLDSKYIEYFKDVNNLRLGDNLHDRIKDAIDKCCLFLPVVSNNLQGCSDYFCREWNYALNTGKKIFPVFKDFVDQDMLLPCDPISDIRQKILNKNNTLGIKLEGNNRIPEQLLRNIKELQYLSRVSGKKQ